jgi:hypothetical protein
MCPNVSIAEFPVASISTKLKLLADSSARDFQGDVRGQGAHREKYWKWQHMKICFEKKRRFIVRLTDAPFLPRDFLKINFIETMT